MTTNTELDKEIDEILVRTMCLGSDYAQFGSPLNTDEENIAGAEALYQTGKDELKQSLITLFQKREREAEFKARIDEVDTALATTRQLFYTDSPVANIRNIENQVITATSSYLEIRKATLTQTLNPTEQE